MAEPLTSDGRVATRGAVERRAQELIERGFGNAEAARICRIELGGRTTAACIAWYRSHRRKRQTRHQSSRASAPFENLWQRLQIC